MTQLTNENIFKIGYEISEILINNKVSYANEVNFTVDSDTFHKIDEDLFYRNKVDENEVFIPSFSEIEIKFPNLLMKIKKEP